MSTDFPGDDRSGGGPLGDAVRAQARALGFDLVGITTPEPSEHLAFYRRWIEERRHAGMGYLGRADAVARRGDLSRTLEGVRSVVVVGHEYYQEDPDGVPADASRAVIARYARGRDYHKVVKKKLTALGRWLEGAAAEAPAEGARAVEEVAASGRPPIAWRAYVDTGPILERDLAQRAGLGWFGKNTMLIHPKRGSYFFLGVLLTDVALAPDEPFKADHCGSCRACLDACPTGALLGRDEGGAPVMDATRCISYLTIEHRGPIPGDLRPLMGNRAYGCDICQEVCPWNVRFAEVAAERDYAAREAWEAEWDRDPDEDVSPETSDEHDGDGDSDGDGDGDGPVRSGSGADTDGPTDSLIPGTEGPSLVALMRMDEDEWDAFTRGSAIRRAGYSGLMRNVAIALGNWLAGSDTPDPEAVGVLLGAMEDEDPVVAEAAAWALGRVERQDR